MQKGKKLTSRTQVVFWNRAGDQNRDKLMNSAACNWNEKANLHLISTQWRNKLEPMEEQIDLNLSFDIALLAWR